MVKPIVISGFGHKPEMNNEKSVDDNSRINSAREIDTLNDVMDKLARETISFERFENQLRKELINVKDLEKNIIVIKDQIKSSEATLTARQNLLERLMAERNKHQNMNIEQCKIYLSTMGKLDFEIKSNIDRIIAELRLLIRDEKSYFDIDKDVRNQISAINEEAQILQNKVILMARYHTSANDIIEQINRDVYMIERERQLRRVGEI